MAKVIFDLIQRFEVEDGVPRLVSSSTKVIAGGEDLMSLATSLLEQLGFDEKFKISRASQYIGYRLKNPGKGAKRYQLVLAQRKEELCISIPQEALDPHILKLIYWENNEKAGYANPFTAGKIWVLPSKKNLFINSLTPFYWNLLQTLEKTAGTVSLNEYRGDEWGSAVIPNSEIIPRNEFRLEALSDNSSYLILNEDKLFPYTLQASISSSEVLEELIGHFGRILMEQQ